MPLGHVHTVFGIAASLMRTLRDNTTIIVDMGLF